MLLIVTVLPVSGTIYQNKLTKESTIVNNGASPTSMDDDWWPMFHHDLEHTGYSTSKAPNTNNVVWQYNIGYTESSPAIVDGKLYIGSGAESEKVYCLNASTGSHIWNYSINWGAGMSSPAVIDGRVYIGSNDWNVYCLDAENGSYIWSFFAGGSLGTSPSVADGKVYIGCCDRGKLYCLNAYTGDHLWNYSTEHPYFLYSSPAVWDGKVYIGSHEGKVYCLDAFTGDHIWNYTTGGAVFSSPALTDGNVYIGSVDHDVYCLDAATGDLQWICTTNSCLKTCPAVAYGYIYLGGDNEGKVYCINASTGRHVWSYTTDDHIFTSPAVADEKIYIVEYNGKLYCLDAYTGSHIWNFSKGGISLWSSPAVADRRVYTCLGDGNVYAFEDPAEPNLDCEGDLEWTDVKPLENVEGNFTVKNIGDPFSELDWKITEWPEWGTWEFTPSSSEDLTPEDGPVTIEVEVEAPNEKRKTFTGEIKIINSNNPSDNCTIDVSLSTPKNKAFNFRIDLLSWLFERFPNMFPMLRYLLGLYILPNLSLFLIH